jgi:hypothetical protein
MPNDTTNPHRTPAVPRARPGEDASGEEAHKSPWDNEPTWPGTECDDDESVAEMGDDDADPPWPWKSPVFGFQQASLWDEALDKVFASKSRGGSA